MNENEAAGPTMAQLFLVLVLFDEWRRRWRKIIGSHSQTHVDVNLDTASYLMDKASDMESTKGGETKTDNDTLKPERGFRLGTREDNKDKISAKSGLESYCFNMKTNINDEKITNKCNKATMWLDRNQLAEVEVEGVYNPIITKEACQELKELHKVEDLKRREDNKSGN